MDKEKLKRCGQSSLEEIQHSHSPENFFPTTAQNGEGSILDWIENLAPMNTEDLHVAGGALENYHEKMF